VTPITSIRGISDDHFRAVAISMRSFARIGVFDGRMTIQNRRYMAGCTRTDLLTGSNLIYTRDTGHHSSGWMKNPDYERCLHLSISYFDPVTGQPTGHHDQRTSRRWLAAFFGDDARLAWAESPKTDAGRSRGVWHWRVFCDPSWEPILPRGEVYSTELTERGWKSFSEVQGTTIVSPSDPT